MPSRPSARLAVCLLFAPVLLLILAAPVRAGAPQNEAQDVVGKAVADWAAGGGGDQRAEILRQLNIDSAKDSMDFAKTVDQALTASHPDKQARDAAARRFFAELDDVRVGQVNDLLAEIVARHPNMEAVIRTGSSGLRHIADRPESGYKFILSDDDITFVGQDAMAAKNEFNRLAESRGLAKLKVKGFTVQDPGRFSRQDLAVLNLLEPEKFEGQAAMSGIRSEMLNKGAVVYGRTGDGALSALKTPLADYLKNLPETSSWLNSLLDDAAKRYGPLTMFASVERQIHHHGGWAKLTDAEKAKYLKRTRSKINEAGIGGASANSEMAALDDIIAKAGKVPPVDLSQAEKTLMNDLRVRSARDSFQGVHSRLMDLVDRNAGGKLAENANIRAAVDELATGLATLKDLEANGAEICHWIKADAMVDELIKSSSGNPGLKKLLYTARWQSEDMLDVLRQWSGKEEEFASLLERIRPLRSADKLKAADEAVAARKATVAKGGPEAAQAAAELEFLEKGLKPSLQTQEGDAFFSKCVGSPSCKKLMIGMSVAGVGTAVLAGPKIYNAMADRWKDGGWTEDLSSAAFALFDFAPGAMTFQKIAQEGLSAGAAYQFVTDALYLYPGMWPAALSMDAAKMTVEFGRAWQLQSYQDQLVDVLATSGVFEGHSFKALAVGREQQIPRDKLAQFLPRAGESAVRNPNKPQEWITVDLTKLAAELYARRYAESDPALGELQNAYQQTWRKIAVREGVSEMQDWQWFQAGFTLYDYLAGWDTVCSDGSKWKDNWCQLLDQYRNAMRKRARAVYPSVMVPHLIALAEEAHKAVEGPQEMVKELMELQRALEELRGGPLGVDLAQEAAQRAAAAADPRLLPALPDISTERQKQLAEGKYLIQATAAYEDMRKTASELRASVAEKTGLTMAPVLRFGFSGDFRQDSVRHKQSRRGFAADTARVMADVSAIKRGPPLMDDATDRQALGILAEVIYPERGSLDAGNQATAAEDSGRPENDLKAPQSPKGSLFQEQYAKALEKVRALYLKTADLKKQVEAGAEIVPGQSVLKAGEPVNLELRFKDEKLRKMVNDRAVTFRWSADNLRATFTEPLTTKTGFTTPEEGKVTVGVVFALAGADPPVEAEIRKKLAVAEGRPDVVLAIAPRAAKPGAKATAGVRPRGKLASENLTYAWRCQNCALDAFEGSVVKLTAPKEGTATVVCAVSQTAADGTRKPLIELTGEITVSSPPDATKQPAANPPATDPDKTTSSKGQGDKQTGPGLKTDPINPAAAGLGATPTGKLGQVDPIPPPQPQQPFNTGAFPPESGTTTSAGQPFASSTATAPPAFPGFTVSASGPWEGTADANGFSAKRKEAVLMSAGCKGNDCKASVNASIEVRRCDSFCAKSPQELEASLRNGMDQRGEIRAVSASGFQGYVIFHKARIDYRCPYVDFCWVDAGGAYSGFVRGAIMRDGQVFSISGGAGGTGVIWGHVNTTWSRNDAQFLDSEANAAMGEMMGIIGSLRIGAPAFKSDGTPATNKTFGAEEAKPLAVKIVSDKPSLGPNAIATVKAMAEGGKPPYAYAWTGPVPPAQAKAESIQAQAPAKSPAAPLAFGVVVTDAEGKTATAAFSLPVSDLRLSLSKTSPAEARIPVGGAVGLKATLTEGGKPADAGQYVIRWEPATEVRYAKAEGPGVLDNSAVLLRPGRTKLWAVALAKEGATLSTAAESAQVEVEAVGPSLALAASPTDPLPGQEVVIRATETPKMTDQDCSYFWEDSQGGAFSGAASDPRRYALTLKGDEPVRITARLKGKAGGEELAAQTLTVTPRKVQVKITNLGHAWGGETTKPLVWKPGVGPVRLDKEIVAGMDVGFRAEVAPIPEGRTLRYAWSVGEGSSLTGGPAGRETRAQRSTPGSLEVRVEVRDQNNVLLGRDATTVQVTISQEAIKEGGQKAKETETTAAEAKTAWAGGDAETACAKAKAALAADPKRTDVINFCENRDKLVRLVKEAKTQIEAASGKENTPAGKAAQKKGAALLAEAKAINPKYPPLVEADKQLTSGADKRAKEEAACAAAMNEANDALNRGDRVRAKTLFESVAAQGCPDGCKALFNIGSVRKQENDLKGAAEAFARAAACEPANKAYADAAKGAKKAAETAPVAAPQGQQQTPAAQQPPKPQVQQPAQPLPTASSVAQPPQPGQPATAAPPATGPAPPASTPSAQPAKPPAPPQTQPPGVVLAGGYTGTMTSSEHPEPAAIKLTVAPALGGGGKVTGSIIFEKLEVAKIDGTVDAQGRAQLALHGGKDYADITGSLTGQFDAKTGKGQWRAADKTNKATGAWSVKAK